MSVVISKERRRPLPSREVGRPRKSRPGESTALGFKVEPDLVRALDEEAERMTSKQEPGRGKVSRTEVIKMVLYQWLADRKRHK